MSGLVKHFNLVVAQKQTDSAGMSRAVREERKEGIERAASERVKLKWVNKSELNFIALRALFTIFQIERAREVRYSWMEKGEGWHRGVRKKRRNINRNGKQIKINE